ncbi:MAG TPA: AMP-binding protein [Desulfosalsimonadaceae bacterium]|nr:AMP-binding protein [Desulfosalsimonadaceae bacterium]
MTEPQFWKKSWDPSLDDLDPSSWEISYVDAIRPTLEKYSDTPAMSFMEIEISFRDLDRYSNRFAHMLMANGLKKGDVVGINLPNIPEYVIAWLGTLKAGCAVSGVSPLLSADELKHQLSDAKAKALVTLDAIFAARVTQVASDLPSLQVIAVTSVGGFLPFHKRFLGQLLGKIPKGKITPIDTKTILPFKSILTSREYSEKHPNVSITPDDIAYIQYTGGTTGPPKGAMLSHKNVMADVLIIQAWLQWEEGQGLALSGFPFFHIAGLFFNINCVYLGWTQVLIPDPRNTDHICKQIEKYRPTALANVPSLYYLLIQNPKFKELDHSNLEAAVSAAAPFPEESQRQLEKIIGEGKLVEAYGMTETSPLSIVNPYKGKKKLGHIGLPLLNTDVKLVDPASGEPMEIGQPGEICVKGPQVMVGYLNNPEETEKAIDADGYMHTGDVGIFDEEGYVRIVDRTKDMINVSGFKVFSKKVEEIMAAHPAIDMIATIGVLNPENPGSEIVKAYVTLSPDYSYDGDPEKLKTDIINFAKEKLAPYEVPKTIEIRDELPLTAVGKIDKKELRKEK